jgi:phosphatidate cytidylyltransferase
MKRILTAFILVPVTVYTVLFAPEFVFLAVVAIIASLCFKEYATITGSFAPLGFVAGLLILIAPPAETTLILILSAFAALCLPLAAPSLQKAVTGSGALMLGIVYIFGAWKTAILLHGIDTPALAHLSAGRHWLMFALVVNWFGDTGAYYVGRKFGKRKLAPAISPGKTWEGAIASVATAMIFGLIYLPLAIPGVSLVKAGAIALVANIAGQVGDLAESAIKRSAGVKDSGTLLPGHGGMLDRVDSSLFTLPVLYTIVSLLHA